MDVRAMSVGPPDDRIPDVVCSEFRCEGCGQYVGPIISTHPTVSLRVTCWCGTLYEVVPAALIDGLEGA